MLLLFEWLSLFKARSVLYTPNEFMLFTCISDKRGRNTNILTVTLIFVLSKEMKQEDESITFGNHIHFACAGRIRLIFIPTHALSEEILINSSFLVAGVVPPRVHLY